MIGALAISWSLPCTLVEPSERRVRGARLANEPEL
jgi:hypothetical protein